MSTPAAIRLMVSGSPLTSAAAERESRSIDVESFRSTLPPEAEVIVPAGVNVSSADVTLQLGARASESMIVNARRFAITIYSSKSDAHDWLAGEEGAWRRSMRCLQKLVDDGVPVDAEVVITRPTVQQLPEIAEILGRIRPSRVVFRVPYGSEVADDRRVMLVPRLPLVVPSLEAAVQRLERSRITCLAENLPLCAGAAGVPRRICAVYEGAEIEMLHCATCDPSRCAGVQRDYVAAFGWDDLPSQPPRADVVLVPLRAASPVTCRQCVDDGEVTASRTMRMHLARAAATGAKTLRIVGSGVFWHADAPSLLVDATRLSFDRVEVAGEASGLARFTDSQLARLQGITCIDFPLYGPTAEEHDAHSGVAGAWDRTWPAIERLREFAGAEARPFAVVHDLRVVPAQAESWRQAFGTKQPRFRLIVPVDSDALSVCIRQIKEPDIRAALDALLPACWHRERPSAARNEWQCDERFESSFKRSTADPIGDEIRCAECDRKKAGLLYSGHPDRCPSHAEHSDAG